MYLRGIGVVFIILSGGIWGITLKNKYMGRIYLLEEFIMMMEQMKGSLRHQNYTVEENLMELSKSQNYKAFFADTIKEMKSGTRLAMAWENSCKKNLIKTNLAIEDVEEIKKFGKELGISDLESQLSRIDFYEDKLKQKLQRLNQEKKEQCRLYTSLGVLGGIMAGIILI